MKKIPDLIFVIDTNVEVLAIKEKGLIEIKSESQLGFKDMGVNNKRIEIIKSYLKNS